MRYNKKVRTKIKNMCFLCKIFKCQCDKEKGECQCFFSKHSREMILALGMIILAAIIIISILRERIVNDNQNQTIIYGQGKVAYIPDIATVILGMQVDKAETAEEALKQMNEKIGKIITSVKAEGVDEKDIQTSMYSLYPQYDYTDGKSRVSGYNANQQLTIKVRGVDKNQDLSSKVIAAANNAGANQIISVNFSVSSVSDLKQKARILAIQDARSKSDALFKAAGIRGPKIIGWFENMVQSPDSPDYGNYGYGIGGAEMSSAKAVSNPQVPSGTQEIIIEIGVNYRVK